MHYIVILNPSARSGQAGRQQPRLEAALQAAGLSFEIWRTDGPQHATDLARKAATVGDVVVAAGGDGTVHEVSRGLIEQGSDVPLGVLPQGTGNDFVKVLGMPRRIEEAAQALVTARVQAVDYGEVTWWEKGVRGSTPFVNAIGIGFDAAVARAAASFKHLPGITSYLAAVARTLRQWDGPAACVVVEQDGCEEVLYDGPMLLATAANGVSSGGTFYLTPEASITDGQLDLCLVEDTSPRRILRVLPKAIKGQHTDEPEVRMMRATRFRLESEVGLPVHADGEMLAASAQRIEVQVVPGGLNVLINA